MKRTTFIALLNQTHATMAGLTNTKGQEYSRSDDDQLANFKRLAEDVGISPEAVCLVYLTKHLDSIKHHIKHPFKALSEPIEGRIDDAILYLILMKGLFYDRYSSVITEEPPEDSVSKDSL